MIKKIIYLVILTSLLGANIISINLGFFQLSIFRGLILILLITIFIDKLKNRSENLIINKKENSYSIQFMFTWAFYALFTLAWVKDFKSWLQAIYFLILGFICIILFVNYLDNRNDILKAFKVMSIMSIFHNLLGWYEIATGKYLFLPKEYSVYFLRSKSPVSMFGNTNDYATFMLFSVFILYICLTNTKNFCLKLAYTISIISSMYLIVMTGSRANILGLILGVGIFMFYSIPRKVERYILLIILIFIFLIVILLFSDTIYNSIFGLSGQISSDRTRVNLIKNGFYFLIETFGFGTGAGNIEYWMSNRAIYYTEGIANIHNWWMEILSGYGILIFIMYIVFYAKLFISNYRNIKHTDNYIDKSISLGIMCCMVGYVIGSISSSSNFKTEWLWVFWGIAVTFQGINKQANNTVNYNN